MEPGKGESAVRTADLLPHPRPRSAAAGGRAPKGNGPGHGQPGVTPRAGTNGMLPAVCSAGPERRPLPMVLTEAVPVSPVRSVGFPSPVSPVPLEACHLQGLDPATEVIWELDRGLPSAAPLVVLREGNDVGG